MTTLNINGQDYPILPTRSGLGYTVLQSGQELVETFDGTWALGCGYTKKRGPFAGYYYSDGWDATDPAYLRLRPSTSSLTITGSLGPTYWFEDASGDGTNFLYMVRNNQRVKINTSAFTLENDGTFPANSDVGHPALF